MMRVRMIPLILASITVASLVFAAIQPRTAEDRDAEAVPSSVASRCVGWDRIVEGALGASDLATARIVAQRKGTYVQPHSNAELTFTLTDGLTFVDTVGGQRLGVPFDPTTDAPRLARVRISGVATGASLVVMGSIAFEQGLACEGPPAAASAASVRSPGLTREPPPRPRGSIPWPPAWARGRGPVVASAPRS